MTDPFPSAKLVQLVEWGYPRGSLRAVPPAAKAFSVIHITGNSRLPSAENEVAWRVNDPGLQNSATFFVNRNGSIVQALGDPLRMAPWANGDTNKPDTTNPRIAACVRDGVNPNQRTIVAIENVGYEPGSPITAAQEEACARIVAYYHAKVSVPVSRETVIGHYQLNSVTRPNCPAKDKSILGRIVTLAAQGNAQGEDMGRIADLEAALKRCRARAASFNKDRQRLAELVADYEDDPTLARLEEIKAKVAALAIDVADD